MKPTRSICWLLIAMVCCWAATAQAQDFRVESKVYNADEPEPQSHTVTIFHGAKIYDFLDKPNEITVFDPTRSRIILLDVDRQIRTEVKMERLAEFIGHLKTWAASHTDPKLKFAATPRFAQDSDDTNSVMTFKSDYISYDVKVNRGQEAGVVDSYRQFCDTSAQLNAMVNPGSWPPFPRLAVNESLAKVGVVPEEVKLTLAPRRLGAKPTLMRSEHSFRQKLIEADLQKIEAAGEKLVTFTQVSLEEYLKPAAAAK
jgi:hypothetical protein